MTPADTARALIERAGRMLNDSQRLYLRRVLAGLALATGEMWDDLNATFAHLLA